MIQVRNRVVPSGFVGGWDGTPIFTGQYLVMDCIGQPVEEDLHLGADIVNEDW
jgi:hypothetical protein